MQVSNRTGQELGIRGQIIGFGNEVRVPGEIYEAGVGRCGSIKDLG